MAGVIMTVKTLHNLVYNVQFGAGVPEARRKVMSTFFRIDVAATVKKETAISSETLIPVNESTWGHVGWVSIV